MERLFIHHFLHDCLIIININDIQKLTNILFSYFYTKINIEKISEYSFYFAKDIHYYKYI